MSDLISRKDALDAIQKRADEVDSVNSAFWEGLKIAQDIVEKVPIAELERQEFEWCHDCKEYDQEKHCCHRWTKVIRQSVDEVKNSQWIPVTEALPEDLDRLLATIVRSDGEKRVRSGHYYKGYFMMDNGDTWELKYETDKGVLAWMPLPEPWGGNR